MGSFGRLVVIGGVGADADTSFDLDEEGSFPIGTNRKARFRLAAAGVDPVHVGIHCGPEGVFVDNRSKSSPAKVNGDLLMGRHPLRAGDLLLLGDVTLEYQAPNGSPAAADLATGATPPSPPPRAEGDSFRKVTETGRAPLAGVLMGLGTGVAAAFPLAYVYSWIDVVNPCIGVITVFLSAGFGMLTGLAAGIGMKWGKVRCRDSQRLLGGAVGLVALYFAWAVWVYALAASRQDFSYMGTVTLASLVLDPGKLLHEMLRICDSGAWTVFGGWTPTGIVLAAIWLLEAVIIVGTAWYSATTPVPALFCEACDRWAETRESVLAVALREAADVKERLAAGDLSFLGESVTPGTDVPAWIQVDLASCRGCGDAHSITLHAAKMKAAEGAQPKVEKEAIAEDLVVTREEAEWIESMAPAAGEAPVVPKVEPRRFQWKDGKGSKGGRK